MATLALVPESGEIPGRTPALTDIIGQLRDMADYYEREANKPDAEKFLMPKAMLIVKVYADGELCMHNIGERLNKFEVVGALELSGRVFSHAAGDNFRSGPNKTD